MSIKVTVDGHDYRIKHTMSTGGVDEFLLDAVGEFHKEVRINHNTETVEYVDGFEEDTVCGYYQLITERSMEEVMVELVNICVANEYC